MNLGPLVCPDSCQEQRCYKKSGVHEARVTCTSWVPCVPRHVAGLAAGIGGVRWNVLCGAEFALLVFGRLGLGCS